MEPIPKLGSWRLLGSKTDRLPGVQRILHLFVDDAVRQVHVCMYVCCVSGMHV